MNKILLIAFALSIGGCATRHFEEPKVITLSVVNNANERDAKTRLASSIIEEFLMNRNIYVVEERAPSVSVKLTEFDPGNPALRYFVGFGAGRTSLFCDITLHDAHGSLVDKINGHAIASNRAGRNVKNEKRVYAKLGSDIYGMLWKNRDRIEAK